MLYFALLRNSAIQKLSLVTFCNVRSFINVCSNVGLFGDAGILFSYFNKSVANALTFFNASVPNYRSLFLLMVRSTSEIFRLLSSIIFVILMFKHCLRFQFVASKWVNGPSLEKKIVKLLVYETKISHHSFKIIFMQLSAI